jgi:hypothetical protein
MLPRMRSPSDWDVIVVSVRLSAIAAYATSWPPGRPIRPTSQRVPGMAPGL